MAALILAFRNGTDRYRFDPVNAKQLAEERAADNETASLTRIRRGRAKCGAPFSVRALENYDTAVFTDFPD